MVTSEEKVLREAVRKYWKKNNSFSKNNYKDIKAFLEKEYIGKNISNPKLQKPFLWIVFFGLGEKITASSGKDKKTYDETLDSILKAITLSLDFSVNRYAYTIVQTLTYAINRYDCKEKYVYIDILSELKEKEENEEKVNDLDSLRQKNTVLIQENKDLSTENEKLKKEISEKEKLIRELEDEDETYKRAVRDNLVNQNKISHEDHISEINDKNDEIKKYKNRIEQLSNQIQAYQEEKKEILSEKVVIKNKLHYIQEENEKLLIKVQVKETEIEKYKKIIKQYEFDKNKLAESDIKKKKESENKFRLIVEDGDFISYNLFSKTFMSFDNPINAIQAFSTKHNFNMYGCKNISDLMNHSICRLDIKEKDFGEFIGCTIDEDFIWLVPVPKRDYTNMWYRMYQNIFDIKKYGLAKIMIVVKPLILKKNTMEIISKGELKIVEEYI